MCPTRSSARRRRSRPRRAARRATSSSARAARRWRACSGCRRASGTPRPRSSADAHHRGFLIVDGLLSREVDVLGRRCVELLGHGDVMRPWAWDDEGSHVQAEVGWTVLEPTRLAVLDHGLVMRIVPWPQLGVELFNRGTRRAHHLAVALAIAHHQRVDDRLLLTLWHLAERWGRVHAGRHRRPAAARPPAARRPRRRPPPVGHDARWASSPAPARSAAATTATGCCTARRRSSCATTSSSRSIPSCRAPDVGGLAAGERRCGGGPEAPRIEPDHAGVRIAEPAGQIVPGSWPSGGGAARKHLPRVLARGRVAHPRRAALGDGDVMRGIPVGAGHVRVGGEVGAPQRRRPRREPADEAVLGRLPDRVDDAGARAAAGGRRWRACTRRCGARWRRRRRRPARADERFHNHGCGKYTDAQPWLNNCRGTFRTARCRPPARRPVRRLGDGRRGAARSPPTGSRTCAGRRRRLPAPRPGPAGDRVAGGAARSQPAGGVEVRRRPRAPRLRAARGRPRRRARPARRA